MRNLLLFVSALSLAACSSTTTATDASDAADASNVDAPASDANEGGDDVPAADVPVDAGSLIGRWRMTGLDVAGAGGMLHFGDENAPIPGGMADGRCNGMLTIEQNRLSLGYGVLANDHFLPRPDAPTYAEALGAGGVTVPGNLIGNSFSIGAAGMTSFDLTPHADGTISSTDPRSGSVTTWTRAETLPTNTGGLVAQSLVVRWNSTMALPLLHPHAALAWDDANASSITTSNDTPLTFMGEYSLFGLDAVSIPPAAAGSVSGTQVAIAYVIVYDDLDLDGHYTPGAALDAGGSDMLRGFAPIAVAYRSPEAPSAAFALSPLRDLLPGWQFVNVHVDYTTNSAGVSPFDPTHVVTADVAVDSGPISASIPNLVP
jgi:hypothetical protein